ncbi:M28 family metallopeptidase [Chryseobacterium sp. PMSZPI]|uniref:M28 family metallopeptidase n=1 Tax=Chryseobacterium sp. PMSZPI TaxID=1033900 RepID=UPI000C33632A|nr:M28 family metallopeptidase [Chryseobacterium sp. PMSZPI]PKF76171.1 peptidase M28 [Chryseobacterium sp. PMSZPI]
MKKLLTPLLFLALMAGCGTSDNSDETSSSANDNGFANAYKMIRAEDLKKNLYIIASDEMEGRNTGSKGQKKAGEYIINYYKNLGISYPKSLGSYYQKVPAAFLNQNGGNLPDSENIMAFIEGNEKPNEIVVVSAHYDHVGIINGVIYNGADDDGSGTVAVMEMAKAFQEAKNKGKGPKRSVLFLHVTGEEYGLFGSLYYTKNPVFPLANTVVDLNIDMIGRDDPANKGKQYVYVIGSDMLSSQLKVINEAANKKTNNLELNYKYDDLNDPEKLYYRSDHYNFAKNNIPIAFFFDGIHEDYHKPTDKPDKIDYPLLEKRTQLIFTTAWDIANRAERIIVDKK